MKKENYNLKISIRNWAEGDRPREKMLQKGKKALSDAELMAILIGSGNKEKSAVELSKEVLEYVGNDLIALSKMSIPAFIRFKGIGEAKAITIAAALELGRRRRSAESLSKAKITGSNDAFEMMSEFLLDLNHEEFWIVILNRANKVVRKLQVSEGGFSGTVADPKKIFVAALENHASAIILCHNHPSGNLQPSAADKKLTQKLADAGKLMDLPVLDHIIFGEENYYSFADQGLL
ncbi:MAG: DNA repair protein RadC [Bacteroidales bacterium]|nr:DNA repair protein RadC [Bacteroidales bacterium]